MFYNPLHPYTWGLLESLPRHDVEEKGMLLPIHGQPPSLIHLPAGCSFRPRCVSCHFALRAPWSLRFSRCGPATASCHFSDDEGWIGNSLHRVYAESFLR